VAAGATAIVSGHSHRPEIREHQGVVYLNPGSAGPRRFDLPVSMAKAIVEDGAVRVRIITL
jgi:hypothetical protein